MDNRYDTLKGRLKKLLLEVTEMCPEFPREANTEKMMIRPSMGAYVS